MAKDPVEDVDAVRERLLRGSISLIEQEGCSSLGVRRLAQAAERSSMCVYSHFGSRGGLLTGVYERVAASLVEALAAGDPSRGYREWAGRNPQLYSLLFDHPLDALDVDARARGALVATLLEILTLDGWTRLHGEISYARIAGQPAPAGH